MTTESINLQTPEKNINRRKVDQLLIIPGLQLKFLSYIALTGLGLVSCFGWAIYLFMNQSYQLILTYAPDGNEVASRLAPAYNNLLLFIVLAAVGFVFIIAIMAFFFSHKIAGPIHHINTVLNLYSAGNKKIRVSLRPKDELHFLADSLNKLLEDSDLNKN